MAIVLTPRGLPRATAEFENFPLQECRWIIGSANGERTLSDLSEDSHVILRCGSEAFFNSSNKLRCKVSLLISEPPVIQQRYYVLVRLIGRRFHRVFTHYSGLLRQLPNARFMAHGGNRIDPPYHRNHEKTKRISLVASRMKRADGHRLRHRIAQWSTVNSPDLALMGRGYREIHNKIEAHGNYLFSVVIENSRSPGYFTEKLIESFSTMCLPIYWGAPDISHFFDHRGMIICSNEREIKSAILKLSQKDYLIRREFLEINFNLAMRYLDKYKYAAEILRGEDSIERARMD